MSDETEKKTKKLEKVIEGTIVKITEGITGEEMLFDFSDLPAGIQEKFGPFGLGHKLGDSAAGKEGTEAVASINKVWDGLMKGDWSVRAPAAEKITKKGLADNISKLPAEEAAAIRASLAKLGIKL
jgi:hypothetical protein